MEILGDVTVLLVVVVEVAVVIGVIVLVTTVGVIAMEVVLVAHFEVLHLPLKQSLCI